MVQAYAERNGTPIRDKNRLLPMLHPGDMLVWEHRFGQDFSGEARAYGGHVQTIQSIDHESGRIVVLQGNMPISGDEGRRRENELRERSRDRSESPRDRARYRQDFDEARNGGHQLRFAPGRRIERSQGLVHSGNLPNGVWGSLDTDRGGQPGHTCLIAAGPPRGAQRPGERNGRGQHT